MKESGIIIVLMVIYSTSSKEVDPQSDNYFGNINKNITIDYASKPICIDDVCNSGRSIPHCSGYINPKSGCCGGTSQDETCCDKDYILYDKCKNHEACYGYKC